MSIFGGAGKLVGGVIGFLPSLLADLLGFEIPSTEPGPTPGRVTSINPGVNDGKLGDTLPLWLGRVRAAPLRISAYTRFDGNNQFWHAYLYLCLNPIDAQVKVELGRIPLSQFPDSQIELLPDGVAGTLVHPNVYTATEVSNVDMPGGAMARTVSAGVSVDFDGDRLTSGTLFLGVRVGTTVIVTSAGAGYDGTWTVTDVDAAGTWVDVDGGSFTPATLSCNMRTDPFVYDEDDTAIKALHGVEYTADSALSQIAVTEDTAIDPPSVTFQIGDVMGTVYDAGPGLNDDRVFTVLGFVGDWTIIVSPAPDNETIPEGDLVLARRWTPPTPVCLPGDTVRASHGAEVDIVFPQGLVSLDTDQTQLPRRVYVVGEYRPVDDHDQPMGEWVEFADWSHAAKTVTPQRFTHDLGFGAAGRYHVRFAKATTDSTKGAAASVRDTAQLYQVKGFVRTKDGSNDPATTPRGVRLMVRARSSGIMAASATNKLYVTAQSVLYPYDADTQSWGSTPVASRAIVDVLGYLMDEQSGGQFTRADLDMDALSALADHADDVAATCDLDLRQSMSLWDLVRAVCTLADAEPYADPRTGKVGMFIDQAADLGQMFVDGINAVVGEDNITLRDVDADTGLIGKFVDPRLGEERDGPLVGSDDRVSTINVLGSRDYDQTWRVTVMEWRRRLYRTQRVQADVGAEGGLLRLGEPVLIACAAKVWGQGTELVSRSGNTLTVDPPPIWGSGQHYVYLRGPDGGCGAKINCSQGAAQNLIVLDTPPDVTLIARGTTERPTIIALGYPGNEPVTGIVGAVSAQGRWEYALTLALDDSRMYAALPTPPADTYVYTGSDNPALEIATLTLSESSGTITATASAVTSAALYVFGWRYSGGDVTWVQRGSTRVAHFTVPSAGTVEVQAYVITDGGAQGPTKTNTISVSAGSGGSGALAVTISSTSVYRSQPTGVITTESVSAPASGGTPPYAGTWVRVSGSADIVALSPSAASTQFQATGIAEGETRTAVFRRDVTDAASGAASSPTVTVTIERPPSGGVEP